MLKTLGFRVRYAKRKIVHFSVRLTYFSAPFRFQPIRPEKRARARKRPIYKGFRRFLIWRNFLQKKEKLGRKAPNSNPKIYAAFGFFIQPVPIEDFCNLLRFSLVGKRPRYTRYTPILEQCKRGITAKKKLTCR